MAVLENSTISRFLEANGMIELSPAPYEGGLGILTTVNLEAENKDLFPLEMGYCGGKVKKERICLQRNGH